MAGFFTFRFFISYGQNDTIKPFGVVTADKMNVVYRGILNPISIAVPDCKSFTATAQGLEKISEGHYNLSPYSGKYVTIRLEILKNDDSVVIEEHPFEIKAIAEPKSLINGKEGLVTLSEQELMNAEITVTSEIFDFQVVEFIISVTGQKTIVVSGNTLKGTNLRGVVPGSQVVISEIKVKSQKFNGMCILIAPIIVQTYDRNLYKKDRKYRKNFNETLLKEDKDEKENERKLINLQRKHINDSLRNRKKEEKLKKASIFNKI